MSTMFVSRTIEFVIVLMDFFVFVFELDELKVIFLETDRSTCQLVAETHYISQIVFDGFGLGMETVVVHEINVQFVFGN